MTDGPPVGDRADATSRSGRGSGETPRATRTALQLDLPEADHVLAAVDRLRLPGVRVLRPAHVSLRYPWLPPDAAFAVLDRVAAALADLRPFPVMLTGPERFAPDGRGRRVVHLVPGPDDAVAAVAAVRRTVATAAVDTPDGRDASGDPADGFTPHLSIARVPVGGDGEAGGDGGDALTAVESAVRGTLPVTAVARTVQVRVQYGSWWRVERVLHLGPPPWWGR